MGLEPDKSVAAPCDWPGCAASADPSVSLAHSSPESSVSSTKGSKVRSIGLDVHRDFCEVAIAEEGKVRSAGRITTRPEVLELFAQSLTTDDRVALEVTGNAWESRGSSSRTSPAWSWSRRVIPGSVRPGPRPIA